MRWLGTWLVLLGLLGEETACMLRKRDYGRHDYYAVHLRPGVDPRSIARNLSLAYDGPLGELDDHYIFKAEGLINQYDHIQSQMDNLQSRRRKRDAGSEAPHPLDHVLLSEKQDLSKRFRLVKRDVPPETTLHFAWRHLLERRDVYSVDALARHKKIAERLEISDPTFLEQWHLFNHEQVGHDLNVTGVWAQNITGKGSKSCIVDDGLDMDSDDLKDNYFPEGSYDFNDNGPEPRPRLSDDFHGTRCAGEIAAVRNDVCGVGVAWDSKVSGVRILSKVITNADEALAMNYGYQKNQIYSCSWGPPDDGKSMEEPNVIIKRAMVNGIQKGRGGLGSLFVFAAGNGAAYDDNCNFDGYTNSIYSVTVGGIDRTGEHPYYSEKCSAQLVVTYSSGSGDAIHTTDVGKNKCNKMHGGTSAAGPLVAGMYALVLEVNSKLSWRDVQYITLLTAVKVNQESDWVMNKAVGKEFSHQFGYGKVDAYALVELAKTWKSVKPQGWYFSPWLRVAHEIPQGDQGLASHFDITAKMLEKANLERIEHVTVTMNVKHSRRGDISADLVSPSGMVSHIATVRRRDEAKTGYVDWNFMSVAHWGESGIGRWSVIVKDTNVNDHKGEWTDWRIKLFGESRDPGKATKLPMPTNHDDDHSEKGDKPATHEASIATTTVAVPSHTHSIGGHPTDHPNRPVPNKNTPGSSEPTDASDLLPHPFPTFGVSKRTQIWIYGAISLILIFLAALGGWYLVQQRRKKRWANRDSYDFDLVDSDDMDDRPGAGAKSGWRKRRAGELYDPFAEGSEDDVEMFDVGSADHSGDESDGEAAAESREGARGSYHDAGGERRP